jgi:hypothetical protein
MNGWADAIEHLPRAFDALARRASVLANVPGEVSGPWPVLHGPV